MKNTADDAWPVRKVSREIGGYIGKLGAIWVEGQVTNLNRRPGTTFLSMRDPAADASMSLALSAAVLATCDPPLAEGQQIVVLAQPRWHMTRGTLTLQAIEVRAVGLGALLARLERLRTMLAQEGLFADERKRPLPFLPRVVGLVCGRESDAKHDVVENARRRWPAVTFAIKEVAVQGPYAVTEVTDAIRALDRQDDVDVIVVARGGGDVQELLPFSDEALVRAVAATGTPVVSAIGHEQHAPLLDLVADWRASTPTDAGKRVVPDVAEEQARITGLRRNAWRCVDARIQREESWLAGVRSRPALADPHATLDRQAADVSGYADRVRRVLAACLDQHGRDVAALLASVTALSPQATLDRGYAIVQDAAGAVVRSAAATKADDALHVRLADGGLDVTVRRAATGTGTAPG